MSKQLDVYTLTSMFKKTATNGLWLTAEGFHELLVAVFKKTRTDEPSRSIRHEDDQFVDYVNSSVLTQDKLSSNLHLLEKSEHPHQYEYYTHSGLTKEDVRQEVQRRRAYNQKQKLATQSPQRKSTSFPILPRNTYITKSVELQSPPHK